MGGELEADTAVTPVEGGWVGRVSPRWNVGQNPNGGYLAALAARAVLASAGRPDPLSITAHYVSPPAMGPVAVATEVVRAGRRYATVAARLVQGEAERVRVLAAAGDLSAMEGPTRVVGAPPDVPPPERCVAWPPGAVAPEVADRFELRFPPGSPWVGDARLPDDRPFETTGWIRFADRTEPSTLALVVFSDAFPPTLLSRLDVGWVPTVELTVQVRGRPAPGWVLGTFRTRFLVDGMFEQDGELWDASGRLVALSRQLALVLPRRG